MLHAVNDTGGMIGGHSAFYYLLKNGHLNIAQLPEKFLQRSYEAS